MKNIKVEVGDVLIFKKEDLDILGKTNICEGKVVNILKIIESNEDKEKDSLVFEVKNPYFESYIVSNTYVKCSQIISKKRTISVNKDTVEFKHPFNNTITNGIITGIIKCYNNDNSIDKVTYVVKCKDNSVCSIDSSHIVAEDYEILEIKY